MAASSGGGDTKMLWYLPKGEKQPTSISILAGANVGQLKRALKTDMREEYGLIIPAAKLQIYVTSVDAQALDPGDCVKDIEGGINSKSPLFVDYPDPMESAAKRQRTGDPAQAPTSAPLFDAKYDFEAIINTRINNKDLPAFLEREEPVKVACAEMGEVEGSHAEKVTVLTLWSPRGTGKTSLLRHLALHAPQLDEQRKCGRLLVIDAKDIPNVTEGTSASAVVTALIVWHLCEVFGNSTVDIGGNIGAITFQPIALQRMADIVHGRLVATEDVHPSLLRWIRQVCISVPDTYQAWMEVTAIAFNAPTTSKPRLFVDQAELLVKQVSSQVTSVHGGTVNYFTRLCGCLPQGHSSLWVGTLDPGEEPAEQYTLAFFRRLKALMPLSFEAAMKLQNTMRPDGQYNEKSLGQIMLFSCGVPRLLSHAFAERGRLRTSQTALQAMSRCLDESYVTGQSFLKGAADDVLSSLLLCSATKWPLGQVERVPGTATSWVQVFHSAAAFPSGGTIVVPRVWWSEDCELRARISKLFKGLNIDIDDLLPDPFKIAEGQHGATAAGVPWERLFASCLAGRFILLHRRRGESILPFLDVYPTINDHLKSVLEPLTVCWVDGVALPREEARVTNTPVGKAIVCNARVSGAHHDMLIPVRRGSNEECIAVSCRFGKIKDAGDLNKTKQHAATKHGGGEDFVLLQCCNQHEGAQNFQDPKWKQRQDDKKYAVISGECIVSQLDVLKLFS